MTKSNLLLSRVLILAGMVLFLLHFFLYARLIYPLADYFLFLSPIFTLVGVLLFAYFLKPHIEYTELINGIKELGYQYLLTKLAVPLRFTRNNIFILISIFLLASMTVTFFGTIHVKDSTTFDNLLKIIETNEIVKNEVSKIKYYGFLVTNSIPSREEKDIRNLNIVAIGEKNVIGITVRYNFHKKGTEIISLKIRK